MIFLIPILLIIGVIIGVDHFYFNQEDAKIIKKEDNLSKKQDAMRSLIQKRLKND